MIKIPIIRYNFSEFKSANIMELGSKLKYQYLKSWMNFVISLPICNLSKLNLANTKDSMNNSISVSQISNLKSQISNLKSWMNLVISLLICNLSKIKFGKHKGFNE